MISWLCSFILETQAGRITDAILGRVCGIRLTQELIIIEGGGGCVIPFHDNFGPADVAASSD
jgi:hypothetical protein